MNKTAHHRWLIVWMLYSCILLNAFACSLSHGQQTGLVLSGFGSAFCGSEFGDANADMTDPASNSSLGMGSSCPLCSAVTLSLGLMFSLLWLLLPRSQRFTSAPFARRLPPRYSWPSANPRASPQLLTC